MRIKGWLLVLLIGLGGFNLFGQSDLSYWQELLDQSNYPDNWRTRLHYRDRLTATPYDIRHFPMEIVESPEPNIARVKYEFREIDMAHYVLLVNESPFSHFFDEESRYTVDLLGRGNWLIKRDGLTGEFIQTKIYLMEKDEHSYMRITAGEERCFIDIYIKGMLLYHHVPLGLEFEQVLFSPMARILALTNDSIHWEQIFARADYLEWRAMEGLAQTLSEHVGEMDYADDGAMDRWDNWVFIEDGSLQGENPGFNCSGFLKWTADGFYNRAPYREEGRDRLTIEELKDVPQHIWEEQHSWNRNFQHRDPLFGLTWTRNLSRILWESYTGLEGEYTQGDLRSVPFFQYRENLGFPLTSLEPLLYLAAVDEPGRIYWAALSSPFKPDENSETLMQYHHVFVAVPWFDRHGRFHYRLYESGTETSYENLLARYEDDSWVHYSVNTAWQGFTPVELH